MTDHFDVSTLNWVKGEIDETLKQARVVLEKYAENPEDEAQIHFCAVHLHQVSGTLQMVELFGAGQLASEMEKLADALPGMSPREPAFDVLMRSILLLPDYLEVLQGGQPDSPIILLPLLNELRRSRGEKELTAASVFQPDLSPLPPAMASAAGELTPLAHSLRTRYQAALLKILKSVDVAQSARFIGASFDQLRAAAKTPALRRWFWVGGALAEALADGGLVPDAAVKQLLGKFEQAIKQLAANGENALNTGALDTFVRATLFEVAKSSSSGARVSDIRRSFRLDALLPAPAVLEHIRSGLGGFNSELKKTVSRDVMEELSRVKDVLDLFGRSQGRSGEELKPIADALTHIADVLGLLRENALGEKLRRQVVQIQAAMRTSGAPDESLLMGVAESVLSVESALSDWGAIGPMEKADDAGGQVAESDATPEAEAEHRRVIRQVMKEAKDDLVKAREAINAYVQKPAEKELLAEAPRLLRQIGGSLVMLSYRRVAQVLKACQRFVESELVTAEQLPPDAHLDALADAMMSVEYYLEAFVESRVHPSSVLDVAERAVASLGYAVDSLENDVLPLAAPAAQAGPETYDVVEMAAESPVSAETTPVNVTPEYAPAPQSAAVPEPAPVPAPITAATPVAEARPVVQSEQKPAKPVAPAATVEMDEEIVGIFIEESEDEFRKIGELLPRWSAKTSDEETLRELRRSFHTLKGSGRLVGALQLGEFAWAFEHLLNRVLDGSVAVSAALLDLLQQAHQAMPGLLAQFRGTGLPDADIEGLQEMAGLLAKGGDAPEPPKAAPPPVPAEHVEIADPVLRDIYTKEAETHLAQLGAFVGSCRVSRCRVSDGLVRALHTLCGSSRTAGVPAVAELTGNLEKYAKAHQVSNAPIEPEGVDVLAETAIFVEGVVAHLRGDRPEAPSLKNLPQRAAALLMAAEAHAEAIPVPVSPADDIEQPAVTTPPAEAVVEHFLETDELTLASAFETEQAESEALPELIDFGIDLEADLPGSAESTSGLPDDSDFIELLPVPEEFAQASQSEALSATEPLAEEIVLTEPVPDVLAAPTSAENELVETLLAEDDLHVADVAPAKPVARETPELLDIFANEATDLLSNSDELLQEWADHPSDRRPVEALQRVLHTLKGSARWAGVLPISDLGHALESTFAAVVEGRLPVTDSALHLARRAQNHLEILLSQVKGGETVEESTAIIEELKSLVASAGPAKARPAARVVREYDPDLLGIFLEEGHEILNASDETLQAWNSAPDDKRLVETLQRQLHTLKGGARMAGVPEIGDLGHSLESMLAGVADGLIPVSPRMVTLMQRAQDRLAVMLEQLRNHDPVPSGDDIIADIEALVNGEPAPELVVSETPREQVPAQRSTLARQEAPEPLAERPSTRPAVPDDAESADNDRDRRHGPRAHYELVRVRSDLLDDMVNVAGEASIFRSRVEQQIGGVRFNLSEMSQVVERLRERLRMFDIETEAQIQSRYEETAQSYEDFDPLEFDRFTHMQQLSRSMIESLGDLSSIGSTLHNITRETETLLGQQARVNTELQEGLMHTRMVPLVQNAPRLRRIVRQTCDELGKQAELRFKGAEVEMDRSVVERIMAPLEHLLRNAIAHGIEKPDVREARGKPPAGIIVVHQAREGTEVVVRVSDDGAGINVAAVRDKAIARGLLSPEASLTDKEILLFILESGFSTAESLTQIAGRGVGMDVVNSEVKNLNGSLAIDSEPGKGTTFTIRLPMTLSVSRALLVYAGDDMYAVPLLSIEGIVRASDEEIAPLLAEDAPVYRWLGQDYDVLHLATVLGIAPGTSDVTEGRHRSILLAHSGEHRVALVVDGLLGSREIVVKPIGRQLGSLRALSGATILGDGRVALILELPALIRAGLARRADRHVPHAPAAPVAKVKPTVMVVDDSITVRKVTSRLLERNDMIAVSAKDGMEAVTLLQETIPDVMLLDIEMPRMDGYELATHVRNEPRLRDVPIIMITSRSGDKHRQRAMQIGVNIYMTKPFQESELLENIRSLLGPGHAFVRAN